LESDIKKLYEGMFLIDSAEAAKDWEGILELIKRILTKGDCEIVSVRKWDERALAYPIKKYTRGTYILTYFRTDGKKNHEIERDVQLSERIIRVLILRADHLTEEAIAKDTPATRAEKHREQVTASDETAAGESQPVPQAVSEESQPNAGEKEE
jgi:small subunit ribosomal protein S6